MKAARRAKERCAHKQHEDARPYIVSPEIRSAMPALASSSPPLVDAAGMLSYCLKSAKSLRCKRAVTLTLHCQLRLDSFLLNFFTFLERQYSTERETERTCICWLTPQTSETTEAVGPASARWQRSPHLPRGLQEPRNLNHPLLPFSSFSRKLEGKRSGIHSTIVCKPPKQWFNLMRWTTE